MSVVEIGYGLVITCHHISAAALLYTSPSQVGDIVIGHIVVTYTIFLVMPDHCFSLLTEVIEAESCPAPP